MDKTVYEKTILFEHRFWLQILGDHGRFIFNALSPEETGEIEKAQGFITIFDELLDQARQDIAGSGLMVLTRQAYSYSVEIREFKLHLLKRHLAGKIKIQLTPTFINHMLNELEEYMRLLCALLSGQIPVFHPVHHHLLWLPDAVGHAAGIISNLDEVEKDFMKKSIEFRKGFEGLHDKAIEISGYMRTNLNKFPALSRFNCQAEMMMIPFKEFLEELAELKLNNQLLGTLLPLMADHMAREECYYLIKLSEVSEVMLPDCNPAKPRLES